MDNNNPNYCLPKTMTDKNNFVLWRLEKAAKGRARKVPYTPYGRRASTTDPTTWTSYQTAISALETGKYDGIGYALDRGMVFIDLDHCIDGNGILTPLAQNIVDAFRDTYIEISQSGGGIHIFALGRLTKAVKTQQIEMYDTGRYAALTEDVIVQADLAAAQDRIDRLYKFCTRNRKPPDAPKRLPPCLLPLSAQDIISKAQHSKGGDVFMSLLSGNWQYLGIGDGTQSAADLAFANTLAFYCQCNVEMMQDIFRSSGLYRGDRKMSLAINKAVRDCHTVYSGGR